MAKVSVIVPNYNHARFLPRRIESILQQTYRDFELMILDDMSPDNSRDIIENYRSDDRVRVNYNTTNSGNTYVQWTRGLALTCSEYVWIAESDDYADPTLLSRLVNKLDSERSVGLAVCESVIVDECDNQLGICGALWAHDAAGGFRFPVSDSDFTEVGRDYCRQYMVPWNTIPNASAVLFRRSALRDIGGPVTEMQVCGDWLTYCKILMRSDISRIPEPLNFFRTHRNNVRTKTGVETFLVEERRVRAYVRTELGVRERRRYRKAALMFETQLLIGNERRPPYAKVPAHRLIAILLRTIKFGPGLFGLTCLVLLREQAVLILDLFGLRRRDR